MTMYPNLLILFNTIFSIVLSTVVTYKQAGAQRYHHLSWPRSLDRLGVLPLSPSILLKPRVAIDPYIIGPDWIVDHHDFTCMLPIDTAAALMQSFYEDLARYAATTLSPALPTCRVWLGHILLEIVAPPRVNIDWIIVQNFALDMLRLTKRGYTNTYQINFIHLPTGTMMTFSLFTGLLRA